MWDIDLHSVSYEQSLRTFNAELSFVCQHSGQCNALAAWFEAELCENNVLSNKPSLEYTHWGRLVLPIGTSMYLEKGTPVEVQFSMLPGRIGESTARWHVQVGDYVFSSEDVTQLASESA
jgi:hypothetical protein